MATEVETLLVRLEASAAKFERELDKANAKVRSATRDMEARMDSSMRAIMQSARAGAAGVNSALAGIGGGGAISAAGIAALSDQYARLINQLKGADLGNPAQALGDVAKAAISAGAPLNDTAQLFRELSVAGKETGAGYAENIALTELFAKAMTAEGKTVEDVGDALRSLSTELKYGEGKASDYLEILQESPRLFDAVAKGLGLTKEKLREQIDEEEIGAGKLQQALLKARPVVDAAFAAALPQASQAMANLGTAVQLYVGQTANGIANSQALASVIKVVSDNFGFLANSATAVGEAIAIVLVGRAIIPMIASLGAAGVAAIVNFTAALGSMSAAAVVTAASAASLNAALAFFTNPAYLAVVALAALAGGLYQMQAAQDAASESGRAFKSGLDAIEQSERLLVRGSQAAVDAHRQLGAEQLYQAEIAIKNARANMAAAEAMLTAARAQREYLSLSGGGEGGMIGAANQSGIENTAEGKIGEAKRALEEAQKASESIQNKMKSFEKRVEKGDFKDYTPPTGGAKSGAGGGGSGGAEKKDAFDREVEQFNKKIALLQVEKDTLGLLTSEREKAKAVVELTQAAERAGITLSDEQRAKIEQLATSYGTLQQSLESARAAQQQFKDLQQFIGTSLSGFFSDVVSGGKNASEALMNLTKKLADAALQAALLGQGPLAGLFGTAGSGGNAGGLFGGLFGLFKGGFGGGAGAAFSGYNVTGLPGLAVGTSNVPYDNMPANLHKGEMVIPKYDADLIRNGGAGGGRNLNVSISLAGANGDRVIEEIAQRAVRQGVSAAIAGEQQRSTAYKTRMVS